MMLSRSRPAAQKVAPAEKKGKDISWQSFVAKRDYTGALGVLNFEQDVGKGACPPPLRHHR